MFKVYNMVIWYTCILWNNDHNPLTELSLFFFFWCWWHLIFTLLTTFNYIIFEYFYLIFIFLFFLPSETIPDIGTHSCCEKCKIWKIRTIHVFQVESIFEYPLCFQNVGDIKANMRHSLPLLRKYYKIHWHTSYTIK